MVSDFTCPSEIRCFYPSEKKQVKRLHQLSIGTASANSVESDLGCTSRIYFDNVTLTLHKPRQHNNMCDCSKKNGYK